MNIKQRLIMLVLPVAMLMTGISYAEVVKPALDIQDFSGDTGVDLTSFVFSIDATAFAIVTEGDPVDIPDESFVLTSTGVFDSGSGLFSGTFTVGSLLSGTFDNLFVLSLGGSDGQFAGDVTYTGGSLMGSFTGGSLEGAFSESSVVAKLGPVAVVPVPAAVWLFGSGLLGLVGIARRKQA